MASARNDNEKMPPEDCHQDPKLKEEVESEAEEEEDGRRPESMPKRHHCKHWSGDKS
jgi:hypothetical protein